MILCGKYHERLNSCRCPELVATASERELALAAALREIRIGKTHADLIHPLDEWHSMVFRFHNIACAALAAYEC